MSRDVYSLRIFATGSLIPATGKVGPVVPSGFVYVLRDINVVRRSTGSTDEFVVYAATGGLLANVVVANLDPGSNFQWGGRQVYAQGEQIGFQSLVGTWDVMASGYQLTLP